MTYTIRLARYVGKNTIEYVFINSYKSRDEWNKGVEAICKALDSAGCEVEVTSIEKEDFEHAYITIGAKQWKVN